MRSIAIVHPLSLVGKELLERLEPRPELTASLRLYSEDEEEVGTVTGAAGAATFVRRLTEDELDGVDLTFFCGDIASDRPLFRHVSPGGRAIVLSRGASADDATPAATELNEAAWRVSPRLLVPAPGALLLSRLLSSLEPLHVRSASATLVEPVSELGQTALDTLFEETRALLTFNRPKRSTLFPGQVAFNLLPGRRPGEEVERQVSALLGERAAPVHVQSLQGGIFHAVAASALVELEEEIDAATLRRRLGREPAFTLARHPERFGPIETAGEERIVLGDVRASGARSFWIWAAIDNLTAGGAIPALELADAIAPSDSVVS